MNRLKIFSIALAAAFFASCGDGNTPPEPEPTVDPVELKFRGDFSVAPGTDDAFTITERNIQISVVDETATILMLGVKFAELMPELVITIPGVTVGPANAAGTITLSGDGIVPVAMGGPFPQYTITGFEGSIDEGKETFTFSMTCGTYPVTFTGRSAKIR